MLRKSCRSASWKVVLNPSWLLCRLLPSVPSIYVCVGGVVVFVEGWQLEVLTAW